MLADRSELGRVRGDGRDLPGLLHRLSTADLRGLSEGRGRPTVLTTPKGRIVERLFVTHLGPRGLLLVGSPGCAPRVLEHLARYTINEQTGVVDVTASSCLFALIGPAAGDALRARDLPVPEPFHARQTDDGLTVLGHDGFSGEGFSVMTERAGAEALRSSLAAAAPPAGPEAVEAYRVLRGLGVGGHELTEEQNPLEAGLWDAVSFDKGCYVGQEVVARLNTYDKVVRALMGFELPAGAPVPAPRTPLVRDGREVGRVTSALLPPGWPQPVGLAYVRRALAGPGDEVDVGGLGDLRARLVRLPFELS